MVSARKAERGRQCPIHRGNGLEVRFVRKAREFPRQGNSRLHPDQLLDNREAGRRTLEGQPLPEWTADFDCESWAQFSLKYILAHPAITCVLTETSNPNHMAENAASSLGRMPDSAARVRMRSFIDQV
jgi:diketogulonate reductase-like aldo/keto reductase